MARQPLLARYASNVLTALELAGYHLDCYSVLGDTITTEGRGSEVVEKLIQAGGELFDNYQLTNRFYAVVKLGTQIVSVKQHRDSILVDIVHWSPGCKLEKRG